MAIMHVLVVGLLCHAVMGRVLVLECLLLGTRGCQVLRPVLSCPGIEWRGFLRIPTPGPLTRYWRPPCVATRGLGDY
jgi:hypothetical protein